MNFTMQGMDDTLVYIYKEMIEYYVPEYIKNMVYTPWVFSLLGSALIGLSGILLLIIIPSTTSDDKQNALYKDRKF